MPWWWGGGVQGPRVTDVSTNHRLLLLRLMV